HRPARLRRARVLHAARARPGRDDVRRRPVGLRARHPVGVAARGRDRAAQPADGHRDPHRRRGHRAGRGRPAHPAGVRPRPAGQGGGDRHGDAAGAGARADADARLEPPRTEDHRAAGRVPRPRVGPDGGGTRCARRRGPAAPTPDASSPRPTPPTPWRASTSRWRRTAGPSPATSGSARTSSPRSWTRARTGWTGPSSPTAWPTRRCCMRVFDGLCPAPPHWTVRWDEVRAAFGWVRAMAGVPQDEVFHGEGDVETHTRMACEALASLPQWRARPRDERVRLFAAVLMHDVAKPHCTRVEDGRVTARGHSRRGDLMARRILWEMGAPIAWREHVAALIRHHQVPFWALERPDLERIAFRVSLLARNDDLVLLASADVLGRVCP